MEHDLSADGARMRIPHGRRSQIGDLLQVVHALEMGKHFAGVTQEIREDVVDVSVAVENVGDDNVQIGGKTFFDAEPTKAGESLLLKKCCKTIGENIY